MGQPGPRGPYKKMTAAIADEIIEYISTGATKMQAVAKAGVGYNTWLRYLDKNPQLATRLWQATQVANFDINTALWLAALKGDVKACTWILERRDREAYGRRDPDAMTREQLIAFISKYTVHLLQVIPKKLHAGVERHSEKFFDALKADGSIAEE